MENGQRASDSGKQGAPPRQATMRLTSSRSRGGPLFIPPMNARQERLVHYGSGRGAITRAKKFAKQDGHAWIRVVPRVSNMTTRQATVKRVLYTIQNFWNPLLLHPRLPVGNSLVPLIPALPTAVDDNDFGTAKGCKRTLTGAPPMLFSRGPWGVSD